MAEHSQNMLLMADFDKQVAVSTDLLVCMYDTSLRNLNEPPIQIPT